MKLKIGLSKEFSLIVLWPSFFSAKLEVIYIHSRSVVLKIFLILGVVVSQAVNSVNASEHKPLISNSFSIEGHLVHSTARDNSLKPQEYPDRVVSSDAVDWDSKDSDYKPFQFTHPIILENSRNKKLGGWAEADDFSLLQQPGTHYRELKSIIGTIRYDQSGLPLNPGGRTGISGRGNLTKWGPNLAADPIITRYDPITGYLQMITIQRKDNGQWAIPGGMVEDGDSIGKTLEKELKEETGVDLKMINAIAVYKGYVDDPRNTDNAWIETFVKHLHLSVDNPIAKKELIAGDDAVKAQWKDCTLEFIESLYASHPLFVRTALAKMSPIDLNFSFFS